MRRKRSALSTFSMSALDLFASAMGAFIVIAVILFPHYMKNSPDLAAVAAMREETDANRDAEAAAQARATDAAVREAGARKREAAAEARRAEDDTASGELGRLAASAEADLKACRAEVGRLKVEAFDLVFVVDTTGSMGDVLADMRRNLSGMVKVLQRLIPDLRIGVVGYKDYGDTPITRAYPLTAMNAAGLAEALGFLDTLEASGGNEELPEPMDLGLREAVAMNWRPGGARAIVVVADQPVYAKDEGTALDLASRFNGGRADSRVSAIDTGTGDAAAFLERLADSGGGIAVHDRGRIMESVLLSVLGGS